MDFKLELTYGEACSLRDLLSTFPDWEDVVEQIDKYTEWYKDEYPKRYGVS